MKHTARIQSSIVPVDLWGVVVGLINVLVVGDEHPANTAMAKVTTKEKTLLIQPILVFVRRQMDSDIGPLAR